MSKTFKTSEGFLVGLAKHIENHWHAYGSHTLQPILGIALVYLGSDLSELRDLFRKEALPAFVQAAISYNSVILTIVVATFFLVCTIVSIRKENNQNKDYRDATKLLNEKESTIIDLRQKLSEAEEHADYLRIEYYKLLLRGSSALLGRMVKKHTNDGDHLRASLYAHVGNQFILAGRYTQHPNHCHPNRQLLPDNQGCIGRAWVDGGECYAKLPDPSVASSQEWTKAHEQYNVDKKTLSSLRMKSREYYTKAISNGTMRIGVIVFESTKENVIAPDFLRDEIGLVEENLVVIVDQAKFLNPFITMQNMGGCNE